MRTPRLTLVSDGKPRLRLLMGSKKGIFKSFVSHDRTPSQWFVLEAKKDSPRLKDNGEPSAKSFERGVSSDISLLMM